MAPAATATYEPEVFPYRWLPEDAKFTTWGVIEPWYEALLAREIGSPGELEQWLGDLGELNDAVSQEGVERSIAMTCQTDDPAREAAHLAFVRDIEPKLKPIQDQIRGKYLDSPHRAGLRKERYGSSIARRRTAGRSTARPTSPAKPSWPSSTSSTRRSSAP